MKKLKLITECKLDDFRVITESEGEGKPQTIKMMQLADGCIDLYSGDDDQIVPIMSLGGLGVISVLSNIAPRQTHEICAKCLEGDFATARELQFKAYPLVKALFSEVNPIPVKTALKLIGFEAGPLRLPLTELEPAHQELLKEEMKKYGLIAPGGRP